MTYPTMEQVEAAGWEQLAAWYRFLPIPGASADGSCDALFEIIRQKEKKIMDRIIERSREFGVIPPQVSKKVGWAPR